MAGDPQFSSAKAPPKAYVRCTLGVFGFPAHARASQWRVLLPRGAGPNERRTGSTESKCSALEDEVFGATPADST
jgi:hypothetical protein